MAELAELHSVTLADGVENSLLSYIRRSGLAAGDALPKEEELAERLKVSRHIVREGLSRLKTLGLIDSRKRRGMTLSRPNAFAGVSKLAEARLFSEDERREMMGLRVVMELGMAEFVYRRRTPELLAELRKFAGDEQIYTDVSPEIEFHTRLFAIGGNAMANQFQRILATAFRDRAGEPSVTDLKTSTHREICDALEYGTEAEFRQALRTHFEPYTNW
jgi:DNA-binding FadR family transcriptional regulator